MPSNNEILNVNSLLKISLISAISAISAFIIVFFVTNYATLFFAYDFDIPASFNLSGINFPEVVDDINWSRDALITVLLSKPISAFLGGIMFLVILMLGFKKPITATLLMFWLNVFAFNTAFGILFDDAIFGVGTYEVATAMSIHNSYLMIMGIFLAFIMYKIGTMNGRLIIQSFPDFDLFSTNVRTVFFLLVLLAPWLLVILYALLSTDNVVSLYEFIKVIPVIILLLPFLMVKKPENSIFRYLPSTTISVIDIILVILILTVSIVLIVLIKDGITLS